MTRFTGWIILVGASVWTGQSAWAAEPNESLPVPRPVPNVVPVEPVYPDVSGGYHRTSRYAVWELYGVDRQGQFRARVIYSPYGPYYLYNGKPYPWTQMHPRYFSGWVVQ